LRLEDAVGFLDYFAGGFIDPVPFQSDLVKAADFKRIAVANHEGRKILRYFRHGAHKRHAADPQELPPPPTAPSMMAMSSMVTCPATWQALAMMT